MIISISGNKSVYTDIFAALTHRCSLSLGRSHALYLTAVELNGSP